MFRNRPVRVPAALTLASAGAMIPASPTATAATTSVMHASLIMKNVSSLCPSKPLFVQRGRECLLTPNVHSKGVLFGTPFVFVRLPSDSCVCRFSFASMKKSLSQATVFSYALALIWAR